MRLSPKVYDQMRAVPLFAGLSQQELRAVANVGTTMELKVGAVLTKEKMTGQEAYFILSCGARCSIDGAEVASLGTGQFVGEMSLLDRGPRSATVVADSDMRLLVLEPREFDRLIQASPKIARKLLVEMAPGSSARPEGRRLILAFASR